MTQLQLPLVTPSHPVDSEEERLVAEAIARLGTPDLLAGYSVVRQERVRPLPFLDGFGPEVFK